MYFDSHPVIGLLSVLVMLLGSCLVLAAPLVNRMFARSHALFAALFFLLTRVGFFVIIFIVIGYPAGPDKAAWKTHGTSALEGLLPYVDYPSAYGPFFSYLLAPAFLFLHPYVAPVVVFILFDFLTFVFLHRVGENPEFNRKVATLYLITPLSWFVVVRYGQDEAIGAFFVVLMLILAGQRRENVLPLLAGFAVAFTKVLFFLPALPILLNRTGRLRACLIAAGVAVGCYLPFEVLGGDVFQWRPRVGSFGGPSIWSVFWLIGMAHWWLASIVFVALLASLVGLVVLRVQRMGVVNSVLLLYSGFMLTSPKAQFPYVLLVLPFLCIRVASSERRAELVFLSIYSFLMVFCFYIVRSVRWQPFSLPWLLAICTVLLITAYHSFLLVATLRSALCRRQSWLLLHNQHRDRGSE
ncbi:MAG: hypothetical protein KAW17_10825 [Candidatus Eisenbacteria sp.]|nr:hypothetical protein [Candidatus Eisenbacteria bacterium]